jgi:FK506-binding nuclear protein
MPPLSSKALFPKNKTSTDIPHPSFIMPRRGKRDNEFDDSLERSHRTIKRVKGGEKKEEPKDKAVETTVVDEAAKTERLRAKNKARKDRKKAKTQEVEQERLQEAKEKKERKVAASVKPKEGVIKYDTVVSRLGVSYQDILLGTGSVVQEYKKIRVKYVLHIQNKAGKVLDSSDSFGFRLGMAEVITGWDIGLEGMRQGGVRHLIVPPAAGYGKKDIGAGSGGLLFFKVTLLKC